MKKFFSKIKETLGKIPKFAIAIICTVMGAAISLAICLAIFLPGSVPASAGSSGSSTVESDITEDYAEPEDDESAEVEQQSENDTWAAETAYSGGATVIYNGGLYKARWWTQNETPSRSSDGVWEYMGEVTASSSEEASSEEEEEAPVVQTSGSFKVVAYYPSWKENGLNKLDFSVITHVNYAFAIPTAEGGLRPLENEALAKQVIEKAHKSNRKALLAIGGWSYNDTPLEPTFKSATENSAKLKKFGDAIIAMCNKYGFDGIDMDWEHPRKDDSSMKQYEELMLYLSKKLKASGKLLTSAVLSGATPDNTIYYDAAAHTDKVLAAVDWINVMAYDGGDGERHSPYDFAVNCGKYWKNTRKMPASKVVLGVPFYARPSWAAYADILAADSSADKKDTALYNGMQAYYNGVATITKKTKYAKQNLGGIMIWEITQDTTDKSKSLLQAIGKAAK